MPYVAMVECPSRLGGSVSVALLADLLLLCDVTFNISNTKTDDQQNCNIRRAEQRS